MKLQRLRPSQSLLLRRNQKLRQHLLKLLRPHRNQLQLQSLPLKRLPHQRLRLLLKQLLWLPSLRPLRKLRHQHQHQHQQSLLRRPLRLRRVMAIRAARGVLRPPARKTKPALLVRKIA